MATQQAHTSESEATVIARCILNLVFSERDKVRMHDLGVRNQANTLSPAEKEDLLAFGKAGDPHAIHKSKARWLGERQGPRAASPRQALR